MPVNWWWTRKLGVMTFKGRNNTKYKVNIYCGNCLGVMIYDYKETDENGKKVDMYNFMGYWNDDTHLKQNLGLQSTSSGYKENIYNYEGNELVKLELNTYFDDAWKIAKLFAKAFKGNLKITMYYKAQNG